MILWWTISRLEKDCSMPDLQQSTDAELEELLASETGDRKKAIAAEILRRRQEAKVKKWSGGNVLLAGLLGTIVASLFALKRWLSRR
jgi:hypothetical protein